MIVQLGKFSSALGFHANRDNYVVYFDGIPRIVEGDSSEIGNTYFGVPLSYRKLICN